MSLPTRRRNGGLGEVLCASVHQYVPRGRAVIDALPLRRHLIGEPDHVLSRRRGHHIADPLIFITAG